MGTSNWETQVVNEKMVHMHFVDVWQQPINRLISRYVRDGKSSDTKRKFWHFLDARIRKDAEMRPRKKGGEGVFNFPMLRGDLRTIDIGAESMESKMETLGIPATCRIDRPEFEELFVRLILAEHDKSSMKASSPCTQTTDVSQQKRDLFAFLLG